MIHALVFAVNILIAGDSVSLGYTPYIQQQMSNVSHVGACWFNQDKTTQNLSNGGNSLRVANCMPTWLSRGTYTHVIFNAGLHDVFVPGCGSGGTAHRIELSDYLQNLQTTIDEIRAYGATPIFITTTPIVGEIFCHSEDDIKAYNAAAVSLMRSQGIAIIPISSDIFADQVALHGTHGIHFTPEGYSVIAQKIITHITGIVGN